MSQLKIKNGNSWESIPAGGIGVPSGGTQGQCLVKSSSVDYATEWATIDSIKTNTFLSGVIEQTICGRIVVVKLSGAITSIASKTSSDLATLTEKLPSSHISFVATSGGNSPKEITVTINSGTGVITANNRSDSAANYIYGTATYIV